MTSYLKILPLFMMVMPGMISRVLFPGKCRGRHLFPPSGCANSTELEKPFLNKSRGSNASNVQHMKEFSSSLELEGADPPRAAPAIPVLRQPCVICWKPSKLSSISLRKQFTTLSRGTCPETLVCCAWECCLSLHTACFRSGGLCRPGHLPKNLWQPLWLL